MLLSPPTTLLVLVVVLLVSLHGQILVLPGPQLRKVGQPQHNLLLQILVQHRQAMWLVLGVVLQF